MSSDPIRSYGTCRHCGQQIERLTFFDDGRGQWVHTNDSWLRCDLNEYATAEPVVTP